jgi:hypothetical protein
MTPPQSEPSLAYPRGACNDGHMWSQAPGSATLRLRFIKPEARSKPWDA